eukprot:273191-Chlamydomonas_euryale.AAC.1
MPAVLHSAQRMDMPAQVRRAQAHTVGRMSATRTTTTWRNSEARCRRQDMPMLISSFLSR